MQIQKLVERGAFGPREIEIMTAAYEEALRLTGLTDRTSPRAASIAQRVIVLFEKGEDDATRIAKLAIVEPHPS